MAWHAVYRTDTGTLISVGSVMDALPSGFVSREYAERPDQRKGWRWSPSLLDFEDRTADLPALLSRLDFWQRLTAVEREDIHEAAAGGILGTAATKRLRSFVAYVRDADAVNLRDAYIIDCVNAIEAAGLIGAGRAATILDPTGLL